MTKLYKQLLTIFTIIFLIIQVGFAQKYQNKSRLNVGQNAVINSNTTITNLKVPTSIKYNLKSPYNQYYRDKLLIGNAAAKSVPSASIPKESQIEKVKIGNIYPNPAGDFANIDYVINSNIESANITFFNLLGKSVATYDLIKFNDKLRINTSMWESGIYMYQLTVNGRKVHTKKLLVNHN